MSTNIAAIYGTFRIESGRVTPDGRTKVSFDNPFAEPPNVVLTAQYPNVVSFVDTLISVHTDHFVTDSQNRGHTLHWIAFGRSA